MTEGGASEGFASSNLDHKGARDKDSYFHMSDASKSTARENEEEFRRVKADFLRVARQNRRRELSRSESSSSPSPIRRRSSRRSDVRDILLQPFLSHKYIRLKGVLIEKRGLTTPEQVNKVISGEKLGTVIPSSFLRRPQKTAGFGTTAVVGTTSLIRQMPACIRAHLATTPDSTSLESLAVPADRAIASENDVKDNSVGVAEVRVNDSGPSSEAHKSLAWSCVIIEAKAGSSTGSWAAEKLCWESQIK